MVQKLSPLAVGNADQFARWLPDQTGSFDDAQDDRIGDPSTALRMTELFAQDDRKVASPFFRTACPFGFSNTNR